MRKRFTERPLWERVILRSIAQSAHSLVEAAKTDKNDLAIWSSKERIHALSDVLRELRQKDRKRALAEVRRISQELGLYDDDDTEEDADDNARTIERDQATV